MPEIARKLRIFYPIEIMISFRDKQRYVQRKHLIACLTPNQMTSWLKRLLFTIFHHNINVRQVLYIKSAFIGVVVFPVPPFQGHFSTVGNAS